MMQQCAITKQEHDDNFMYRTNDGYDITRELYLKTQLEEQKNTISLQEAKDYLKRDKEYKAMVCRLILYTKKMEKLKGISKFDILKEIMKEEQLTSVLEYNKYRVALTKKEHYNIMKIILSLRDKDIKNIEITRKDTEILNGEILQKSYLRNLRHTIENNII